MDHYFTLIIHLVSITRYTVIANSKVATTQDNTIIIITTITIGVFILGLVGFTIVVVIVCTTLPKKSGYT